MEQNKKRHPCFMDEGVYERLAELARYNGNRLYEYTNELLSDAIQIEEQGISLRNIKDLVIILGKITQNYKGHFMISPVNENSIESWKDLGASLMTIMRFVPGQSLKESVISLASFFAVFLGEMKAEENGFQIISPFLNEENIEKLVNIFKGMEEVLTKDGIKLEIKMGNRSVRIRVIEDKKDL
ncbi:hypothetical protein CM19_08875 [Candidatus Acidianus copahuensis]|uniref:Uncharacterized protein n=1 Tax=Candidatus Acidianus copahuensis TaxID=1160895 RepID=A0A031LM52_9CREN|nr:hypothetical protein [Candidatus Acidianus copahuensis]EZQ03827.1 hypothetical protein CM19_08875 [Candidatus Acidianus copahuensis]